MTAQPPVPPEAVAARESLGRLVHDTWVAWLAEQPSPWPVDHPAWEDRHPAARDAAMRVGEAVAAAERERCARLAEQVNAAWLEETNRPIKNWRSFAALLREGDTP